MHIYTWRCSFNVNEVNKHVFAPAWVKWVELFTVWGGHLLTEPNPLTSPSRNGSLTRLLLYIAAVIVTSLEILVLLICTPPSRFEHFTLHLSPLGNSWCITAAMDQSIYSLPALPSLQEQPARMAIPPAALCNARARLSLQPSFRWITNRPGTLLVSSQL